MNTHQPRKRFGQNFLHDPFIIQKIVNSIRPANTDLLVEIGPGMGALTRPLLAHVDHLQLIELDRDLAAMLSLDPTISPRITLFQQDAMRFNYNELSNADKKLRIVGNLPYNISTPLLFHLLTFTPIIADMHFMLQKEVAKRLVAMPRTHAYGRLSVMIQYFCRVEYLFDVPPGAFMPPPKVDSAIVRLTPHPTLPWIARDPLQLANLVRQAFNQRRKTLRNSLNLKSDDPIFAQCGISPSARAEELTVKDYVTLANACHFNKNNELEP